MKAGTAFGSFRHRRKVDGPKIGTIDAIVHPTALSNFNRNELGHIRNTLRDMPMTPSHNTWLKTKIDFEQNVAKSMRQ